MDAEASGGTEGTSSSIDFPWPFKKSGNDQKEESKQPSVSSFSYAVHILCKGAFTRTQYTWLEPGPRHL